MTSPILVPLVYGLWAKSKRDQYHLTMLGHLITLPGVPLGYTAAGLLEFAVDTKDYSVAGWRKIENVLKSDRDSWIIKEEKPSASSQIEL